ncbi:MAG: DUF177 domain-containing protein [Clostridiales bacterium]|jgi:uncharacterized protein|nr:DUF177 domain-containing protein [Clostridiales bacterium]
MVLDITEAKKYPSRSYSFDFKFTPQEMVLNNPLAKFVGNARFKGSYIFSGGKVYVKGDITYSMKYPCDRCLKKINYKDTIPFEEVFYEFSDDKSDYTYNGNLLDLAKPADDYLILNMPLGMVCDKQCKGICPQCGKNLNQGSCDCQEQEISRNPFSKLLGGKF